MKRPLAVFALLLGAGSLWANMPRGGLPIANGYGRAAELQACALPIAWFRFNWTSSGNMAWEFAAPPPHPVTVPTRTMDYDDDNRLTTTD